MFDDHPAGAREPRKAHDLVLSKLVPHRDKDRRFIRDAVRYGLVQERVLRERLKLMPVDNEALERLGARLDAALASSG